MSSDQRDGKTLPECDSCFSYAMPIGPWHCTHKKRGNSCRTRATIMCAPDTFLAAKRCQVHHSRICGVGYCTVQSQHRTIDQHRVKPNETKSADGSSHHAAFLEHLSTTDVVSYVTIKPTNHHQSSNVPAAK